MSANHERALDALLARGPLAGARRARRHRFHLERLSRAGAIAASWRTRSTARSRAACRSARADRGCCAAIIPSTRRSKRRPRNSSAPRARCFSAAASSPTSRCSRRCPQRGDLVVYDELIHASAHEGMRAGRSRTSPRRGTTIAQSLRGRDRRVARERAARAAVDRRRKPLQHGRRPRAARRSRRLARPS